jgi:hypothetical protein
MWSCGLGPSLLTALEPVGFALLIDKLQPSQVLAPDFVFNMLWLVTSHRYLPCPEKMRTILDNINDVFYIYLIAREEGQQ